MQIITSQEHQRNYKKIREQVEQGEHFIVTHHNKPMFKIVPLGGHKDKKKMNHKESLEALLKITFDGGDPDLSQRIDEIAWG